MGATALAIIALVKYTICTRQQHYLPQLLQLARHLQAAQQPSGAFLHHRQAYPSGEDTSVRLAALSESGDSRHALPLQAH
ncbi:MAG: hypothetical protein HC838_06040 [Spirulinaceae cyanobacterium RM2_2_10]|nr:hypothetical protein [Spirulinaceae cyanobacterium RM2_2_10]